MKYTVAELLKAMRIEDNPNAVMQFFFLFIFIILFIAISVGVKNYAKIKALIVDKNLYNFIIEFKNISKEERKAVKAITGGELQLIYL